MKKSISILLILLILLMAGCNTTSTKPTEDALTEEETYIKYIYPDSQVQYWLITEKKYENTIDASEVVKILLSDKTYRLSDDVKLLDFKIKDRTAFVDLSSDIEYTKVNGYRSETDVHAIYKF